MCYLSLILLLMIAASIAPRGMRNRRTMQTGIGMVLGLGTLLFLWFMNFWGEKLWFDALGYNERFWTVWNTNLKIN